MNNIYKTAPVVALHNLHQSMSQMQVGDAFLTEDIAKPIAKGSARAIGITARLTKTRRGLLVHRTA